MIPRTRPSSLAVTLLFIALMLMASGCAESIPSTPTPPPALAAGLENIPEVPKNSYLPDELTNVSIGMTFEQFSSAHTQGLAPHAFIEEPKFRSYRREVEQRYRGLKFNKITFYFDIDKPMFLYEMIIEFRPSLDPKKFALESYGEPNYGGQWRFKDNPDYDIMIWTLANKIVIAANMEGTEYEGMR